MKSEAQSPTRKGAEDAMLEDNRRDLQDAANRRVVFDMHEARSFTKVFIKLEVDFDAILKLQRKRPEYSRRVCNTLPLMLYDDFMTECKIIHKAIQTRRKAEVDPLSCVVLMKDDNDQRVQYTGEVLDYLEDVQMFIVEVNHRRYLFNRLCVQFPDYE